MSPADPTRSPPSNPAWVFYWHTARGCSFRSVLWPPRTNEPAAPFAQIPQEPTLPYASPPCRKRTAIPGPFAPRHFGRCHLCIAVSTLQSPSCRRLTQRSSVERRVHIPSNRSPSPFAVPHRESVSIGTQSACRASHVSYWALHWNWNETDHREAERSGLGWTPCSVFNTGINRILPANAAKTHSVRQRVPPRRRTPRPPTEPTATTIPPPVRHTFFQKR